jgi:hypothetical protein
MENENTFLLVTKLLGSKEAIKIAAAIESNVKYDLNLSPFYAVMHKLDAEGRKLLDDYDNRLDDQMYWREISAFYLGYATALRLGKRADILTLIRGAKADAETTLKGNFDG